MLLAVKQPTKYELNPNTAETVNTISTFTYGDEVELTVDPIVANAGNDVDLYDIDNLYSEGLSYEWFVNVKDDESMMITAGDIVGGNVSSATIKVLASESRQTYFCIVTNTLNGEVASSRLDFVIRV